LDSASNEAGKLDTPYQKSDGDDKPESAVGGAAAKGPGAKR
jgi:hypothetical protein